MKINKFLSVFVSFCLIISCFVGFSLTAGAIVYVKSYAELQNAIDNATTETYDTYIDIKQDFLVLTPITIGAGKKIILNLCGNTLVGRDPSDHTYDVDYLFKIESGGKLELKDSRGGGKITGAKLYVVYNDGDFIMKGGTISGNDNNGVYNTNYFAMYDGTICGNDNNGVYNTHNFVMLGGTISGNGRNGVNNTGNFDMYNGTISENTNYGVYNNDTFTMTGGTISDSFYDSNNNYVTVTFNANGGSGTMSPQYVKKTTATALKDNGFTAPQCKAFDGWSLTQNGDKITTITTSENKTVYARWKLAHTLTAHAAVPATCTTAGNSAYWSCSVCGKYFSDANGTTEIAANSWVIGATGHSPSGIWNYDNNSHWQECNNGCGKKVDSAAHTASGWSAGGGQHYQTCTVCNYTYNSGDHDLTAHPAVAATCTTDGNNAYWYCDCCQKYFSDKDGNTEIDNNSWVIGKLGHKYLNGVCSRCGAADPNYSGGGKTPSRPTGGSSTSTTTTTSNEPKIEGGNGASGWNNITSEISKTKEGGSVTVDMSGATTVPAAVLEAGKGKDVDLVLNMGGGVTWTINGKDISSVSGSIDLGVKLGTSGVPVDVVNNVTGEHYSTTLHLNHSGAFGFKAIMTVPLRKQDAGLIANLFYYNPEKKALEFVSSFVIDADGNADLDFNHASDYAIVVDDHSLGSPVINATVSGSSVKLTWDAVSGATSYTVYTAKDGKWSKLKTTSKTELNINKLKNNKTYKFLVRAKVNGKLTPVSESYKLTVKVCYKPVLKATTKNGAVTLKWSEVNNATEYCVVKSVNGEWKLVKETSKLSQTIRGLNSGKKYKYAVQAKVNGKWTTIGKASTATVKAK